MPTRTRSGPVPFGPLAAKIVVGLHRHRRRGLGRGRMALANKQKVEIPLPYQNATGGAVTTEAGHVLSTSAATCGTKRWERC